MVKECNEIIGVIRHLQKMHKLEEKSTLGTKRTRKGSTPKRIVAWMSAGVSFVDHLLLQRSNRYDVDAVDVEKANSLSSSSSRKSKALIHWLVVKSVVDFT